MTNTARIIAIVNQKGGVGKTTTSVNQPRQWPHASGVCCLLILTHKVMLALGLALMLTRRDTNSYRLLTGEVDASYACHKTDISGVDILPAIVDLSAAEIELAEVDAREFRLQKLCKWSCTIMIISLLIVRHRLVF